MSKKKPTDWSATLQQVTTKRHKHTLGEKDKELKQLLEIIAEQEQQIDVALGLTKKPAATHEIPAIKSKEGGSAIAVAVASDWHVEETVDPKTVNSLNEFNLDIASWRIQSFFQRIVRMTEIQRNGTKIDTLVLALLGDLMTGYIHEELRETNGLSPTETVLWLQEEVASGIAFLENHFDNIIIPCSYGNHGRNTIKPRHATGAKNSYEWMLYQILRKQFPHLEWQIADGYHNYLEVNGVMLRFHHGDGLKYQGGVGGLTIPVEKAIAQWNRAIKADIDIFGHWHQSQQNPKWISNASLIGHNAYAVAIKAGYELPSQTYFLIDHKRGRTITAPIYLD
jgi:hypothetical protein